MLINFLRSNALLLAAALAFGACGKSEAPKEAPTKASASAPHRATAEGHDADITALQLTAEESKAAGVRVATVSEGAVTEDVVLTATIQANQDKLARIAPRVSGRIVKVNVRLGASVRSGQALAEIDSIEVGEAQAAYAQAFSDEGVSHAAFQRADKLFADQVIAQKDYLRAKSDWEKAKAALGAAAVRRSMLGLGPHGSNKSVFSLNAPFAGVIIDKVAVVGELAQPDKPLFTVVDLSEVWIQANLFEKDLSKVRVGASATVTTAAYPHDTFTGTVSYVGSVMDKESHTAKVVIAVPNSDGRLKLEMFASAAISAPGAHGNAITLPETSIVLIQGQPTVFMQHGTGYEPRVVQLGEKLRDKVIVRTGLKSGDKVVTEGAYAFKAKLLKSQISAD